MVTSLAKTLPTLEADVFEWLINRGVRGWSLRIAYEGVRRRHLDAGDIVDLLEGTIATSREEDAARVETIVVVIDGKRMSPADAVAYLRATEA